MYLKNYIDKLYNYYIYMQVLKKKLLNLLLLLCYQSFQFFLKKYNITILYLFFIFMLFEWIKSNIHLKYI